MKVRNHKKTKVFVGLSGGVDSSVSAALLKKNSNFDVVGVFIKTWQPDFIECTWRDDRRDAMRVAAHLDIPFVTLDLEKEYKKGVADYMISEYRRGRTPNPDVMCNREVKFGAFWKWAKAHGADYIATGHYARVSQKSKAKRKKPNKILSTFDFRLSTGLDPSKDQSYFLWTLNQGDLEHVLFPIGHLKKTEVRKLAKKFDLPTALKKDSQGICMLGPLDIKDFLKHYIKEKKGEVLLVPSEVEGENEKKKVIGSHNGAVFLTLGERHGFTIFKKGTHDAPHYIIAKDIERNTITVSKFPISNFQILNNAKISKINLKNTNWVSDLRLTTFDFRPMCQIRYHGELLSCKIESIDKKKNEATISFLKSTLVSPGQSVVLYDKEICLGGGIVA